MYLYDTKTIIPINQWMHTCLKISGLRWILGASLSIFSYAQVTEHTLVTPHTQAEKTDTSQDINHPVASSNLTGGCPGGSVLDFTSYATHSDALITIFTVDGVDMQVSLADPFGIKDPESHTLATTFKSANSLVILQNANTLADSTVTTLRFSKSLRNLAFRLYDVDKSNANAYNDKVIIHAYSGSTRLILGSSDYILGLENEFLGNNTFAGLNQTDNDASDADIQIIFPLPVDSIQIILKEDLAGILNPGFHGFGIQLLTWCGTNAAPLAQDDSFISPTGISLPLDVLHQGVADSDPDGDVLILESAGSNVLNNSSSQGGILIIRDNGTPLDYSDDFIQYTPPIGFSGADSFLYVIHDGYNKRDTALVNLLVAKSPGGVSPAHLQLWLR
ncbi:MAG: hypothetical protein HC880_18580, partial [Bacteroidia bacterium]|nr:hypothetical protein [Bacteroidia bacterium]